MENDWDIFGESWEKLDNFLFHRLVTLSVTDDTR